MRKILDWEIGWMMFIVILAQSCNQVVVYKNTYKITKDHFYFAFAVL
jgi:hypothetical protein